MWRTAFVVLAATVVVGAPVLAQTGRITGKVTSAEGARPIPGAQVVVAGTTTGAVTRDDGRYTITVQPGRYTVRALRLGFAPDSVTGLTVTANGETTADFSLATSAATLSNIVVVGYGTQEARNSTGAVASVDSTQFVQMSLEGMPRTRALANSEGLVRV